MSVVLETPRVDARAVMAERAGAARARGAQRLVGLIGAGIARSLAPAMHETEARSQGLHLDYQLIDLDVTHEGVQALPGLVSAARELGLAGLNITYPCKQAVIPLLDALSDEARAIGAVNTIVFDAGRGVGHNTDGSGWRWGFERSVPDADLSRVVLLGAGGAGSAIAHSLCRMSAPQIVIVDPDVARARQLADELRRRHAGTRVSATADPAAALERATGLIHATPTGMDKMPGLPVPTSVLRSDLWVNEIVYFPLETPLLLAARAAGCRVIDGGAMAVGQALGAFALFTGLSADPVRMQARFRQLIQERA